VRGEWKVEVGATVAIGQELGTILAETATLEDQMQVASAASGDGKQNGVAAAVPGGGPSARQDTRRRDIEPALSPTLTRKLGRVIPANLQIDARWDAIRAAREMAKKADKKNAPSPSAMIAWAVVRAMERHAPFRRLIMDDHITIEKEDFDLRIAVPLD